MTRRERHLNILKSFGRGAHYHRDRVLSLRGYAAFTDEAIEEIAADTVRSYKRSQKANAQFHATRHEVRPQTPQGPDTAPKERVK